MSKKPTHEEYQGVANELRRARQHLFKAIWLMGDESGFRVRQGDMVAGVISKLDKCRSDLENDFGRDCRESFDIHVFYPGHDIED